MVKRCLQKDERAFKALYNFYSSWLYAVALRYSNSVEDAQDALQESFIRIYKNLAQFSQESNFKAWMKRITIHTALAQHKKKNAKLYDNISDSEPEHLELDYSLLEVFGADELLFYIDKLSPGRKQIFNAYFVEGYSHREIAELFGISEGTSKSQLFDAKKELKKAIEMNLAVSRKT